MRRLIMFLLAVVLMASCRPAYAIAVSGDYLQIQNTSDTPTDITGYSVVRMDASGVPFLRTPGGTQYAVDPSGPNTVTVGQYGDSTTIAGAITIATARTPASTNTITILLHPGTHTVTELLQLPEYVSLVGVEQEGVIVSGNDNSIPPGWYNGSAATTSALIQTLGNNLVSDITFHNLRTTYPSVCLYAACASGERVWVRHCSFLGAAADNLYVRPSTGGEMLIEDCDIPAGWDSLTIAPQGTGIATMKNCRITAATNSANSVAWISGSGTIIFQGCDLWASGTGDVGNLVFSNVFDSGGTTVHFRGCTFRQGSAGLLGKIVYNIAGGTGYTMTLNDCAYDTLNYVGGALTIAPENKGDNEVNFGGDMDIGGDLDVDGDANAATISTGGTERINASGVIPTANVAMSADPTTTYGIATKGYVDERILVFQTLYLEGGASDVGGYLTMSPAIPSSPEDDVTVAGLVDDQIIEEWIGPPGGLGTPTIPAGSYSFQFHGAKTAGIQVLQAYVCLFLRTTLGVETLLGTTEISETWDASQTHYELHMSLTEQVLDSPGDRVVGKVYAVVTGSGTAPTGVIYFQGTTDSKLVIPATSGAYAQLTQPNEFTAPNTFEENTLTNTLLGDNNSAVYGTGATPITWWDAGKNALGILTAFPATGYALTVVGATRITGLLDVNGEVGNTPLWATTPEGGIPSILEAEKSTTGSIATGLYVRGKFPEHAVTNRVRAILGQFDNGAQTNGFYSIARIETVSPFGSGGELYNYQAGSPAVFLEWDETGEVTTHKTQWRDFAAVGSAQGYVTWELNNAGADADAWHTNTKSAATHLVCGTDGETVVFPVPYEPGTVITRLRVKWQAQGDNDGVKIRLLKRDESGATTAWTVVGAQQTYTDPSAPYVVTVSTYDVADETLDANTSYVFEVESEVATTGSNLLSVGLETSERAY